jgi:RNA polymerase subunit RPABC4/transcription elongation factor Spt4
MSWPLNEIRFALSESLFNKIPNETILHMFRFLSVPDLCNVSLVCRSFKIMVDHDQIWKPKCNSKSNLLLIVNSTKSRIASRKLHSKSYKDIYMEWMQEKSLRNKQLLEAQRGYIRKLACRRCGTPRPSYPLRPATQQQFTSIGGFSQHPNTREEMLKHFFSNIHFLKFFDLLGQSNYQLILTKQRLN